MLRAIPATESSPVTSGTRTRPARSASPSAWRRHSRSSHRSPGTRTSAGAVTAVRATPGPLVQAHPDLGVAQGGAGDLAGPLGARLQQLVELIRVVQKFERPFSDGGQGLDHHLAEVLLQVAVALAAEIGRASCRERV